MSDDDVMGARDRDGPAVWEGAGAGKRANGSKADSCTVQQSRASDSAVESRAASAVPYMNGGAGAKPLSKAQPKGGMFTCCTQPSVVED